MTNTKTFRIWNTVAIAVGFAILLPGGSANAQGTITTAAQLQDCVGANLDGWGTTCTVGPVAITLYSEILVSRSGIIIEGDTSFQWGSELIRGSSSLYTMMAVVAGTGPVEISNIFFNGSGSGNLLSQYSSECGTTLAGETGNFSSLAGTVGTPQNPGAWPCPSYVAPAQYYDLDIQSTGPGFNVTIAGCIFYYSPSYSVRAISNVLVETSYFEYVGYTGLVIYARGAGSGNYVETYDNGFWWNGGGGEVLDGMNSPEVLYSTFYQNHDLCYDQSTGGQIDITFATVSADVYSNTVDGNYSTCPVNGYGSSGLEMYGSSHYVGENNFYNHVYYGIAIASGSNITLTNNSTNANYKDGIGLDGDEGSGCGNGVYTITNDVSTNNSWWGLEATQQPLCPAYSLGNLSGNGNNFTSNTLGPTCVGAFSSCH